MLHPSQFGPPTPWVDESLVGFTELIAPQGGEIVLTPGGERFQGSFSDSSEAQATSILPSAWMFMWTIRLDHPAATHCKLGGYCASAHPFASSPRQDVSIVNDPISGQGHGDLRVRVTRNGSVLSSDVMTQTQEVTDYLVALAVEDGTVQGWLYDGTNWVEAFQTRPQAPAPMMPAEALRESYASQCGIALGGLVVSTRDYMTP